MSLVLNFEIFASKGISVNGQYDLKEDYLNIHKQVEVIRRNVTNTLVSLQNVIYYVYSKNNFADGIQFNGNNLNVLNSTKIVFIIHGWDSSAKAKWMIDLKNAFLQSYKEYNIVLVDWKELACQFYYSSGLNTRGVGNIVAQQIVNLYRNHNVKLDDILLVGHSLGAQMTGIIGRNVYSATGHKLPRIIALDPAGPLFGLLLSDYKLNSADAKVVEAVHTNGGIFGYGDPIGTIDFFPNGGSLQPNCSYIDNDRINIFKDFKDLVTCDHKRAYIYFIEAVQHPKQFKSIKCSDWKAYNDGKCNNKESVSMGDLTTELTGKFYLKTNGREPYAKDEKSKTNERKRKIFKTFI